MARGLDVRQLRPEDAVSLIALRREALEADPLAFAASIDDDHALSLDFVRRALGNHQEQAVFGGFAGDDLVGMVGLVRGARLKQRHTAIIWGMYVTARARNRGAGRALLDAAIHRAREWGLAQVQLGVTESAQTAKRLYEALGFRSWGREPRALQWQGDFVDEHHLVLDLRKPRGVEGEG